MDLKRHSMSHLKVHLRFHFKNHEKLQNISRKRCIWRYSKWFIWQCSQGYTFESRYASFISYIEQNKQNCWHPQIRFRNKRSQVFTIVYRKRLMTLWVACEQLFLEVLENYLIFVDKTSNPSKIFLEIRSSRQAVFFKTYFL